MYFYQTSTSSHIEHFIVVDSDVQTFGFMFDAQGFTTVSTTCCYSVDGGLTFSDQVDIAEFENIIVGQNVSIIKITTETVTSKSLFFGAQFTLRIEVNDVEITRPAYCRIVDQNNIIQRSRTGTLYDPYAISDNAKKLQNEMSSAMSDIWGHDVEYFKAVHNEDDASATFREYAFSTLMQKRSIRVVIKNNFIPENRTRFDEFDIDFQQEMEIHIDKQEWQRVFGNDVIPNSDDCFYLPINDSMYIVNAPHAEKNFMLNTPFFKMICIKYEKRDSTITDEFVVDEINEFVEFEDEFNADKFEDEKQTAQTSMPDSYNEYANNISECYLQWKGTEIFRYYYNFCNKQNTEVVKTYNWAGDTWTAFAWFRLSPENTRLFTINSAEIVVNAGSLMYNDMQKYISRVCVDQVQNDEWLCIGVSRTENATEILVYDCNMVKLCQVNVDPIDVATDNTNVMSIFGGANLANLRINKRRLSNQTPTLMQKALEKQPNKNEYYIIDAAQPVLQ